MLILPSSIPSWQAGSPLESEPLNAIAEGLRAALALKVDASNGLRTRSGGGKRILTRDTTRPIWGTLSGSSSPYTFTEALEGSGGAWASGTRTGTAYEVNGKSGLSGKVERLYPDRKGAWRFQWNGATSGTGPCNLSFTLHNCTTGGVSGATVQIVQGGTTFTATTNGSGVATFTGVATGSWALTAFALNARYANFTASYTLVSGSNTKSGSAPAAAGYICEGSLCVDPISKTLTLSGGVWGTQTLIWNSSLTASNGFNVWDTAPPLPTHTFGAGCGFVYLSFVGDPGFGSPYSLFHTAYQDSAGTLICGGAFSGQEAPASTVCLPLVVTYTTGGTLSE